MRFQLENKWFKLVMSFIIIFLFLWTSVLYASFKKSPTPSPLPNEKSYHLQDSPSTFQSLLLSIPFIKSQIFQLEKSLSLWKIHLPCKKNQYHFPKLSFYIDGKFSSQLKQTIHQLWKNLPSNVTNCFEKEIIFLEAKLDSSIVHPTGPCESFYYLLDDLAPPLASHVFLMESDVLPIQSFWLDEMQQKVNENVNCSKFWMTGSISRCNRFYGDLALRKDSHMNGNSPYCLQDNKFQDYRNKVKQFYPPAGPAKTRGCATGLGYENGYDHTFFQYLNEMKNFETRQKIIHKFVYTSFIQNRCEDIYNSTQIIQEDSQTFLVHGKSFFYSFEERAIVQSFQFLFARNPYPEELLKWKAKLVFGEETPDTLQYAICAAGVKKNRKHEPPSYYLPQGFHCPEILKKRLPHFFNHSRYLWTIDFHPGPLLCNYDLFRELGFIIHMEVDHGLCEHFGVCRDRLQILSYDNWKGFSLESNNYTPSQLRKKFFDYYSQDEEFQHVNYVSLSHPVANIELFFDLFKNRSDLNLIFYPTTRLEFGRDDSLIEWRKPYYDSQVNPKRWRDFLIEFIGLVKNQSLFPLKRNKLFIATNNYYDVQYVYYFTGILPTMIPSWCGGVGMFPYYDYLPIEEDFLIGPSRDNLDLGNCSWYECKAWQHPLLKDLKNEMKEYGNEIMISRIRDRYENIKHSDLVRHLAIIAFPYQSSSISFFEYYRLNIPIFAPSLSLLKEWVLKYDITFEKNYGNPIQHLDLVLESERDRLKKIPNPNLNTIDSLTYWLPLFDIYHFPFIQYFDDWKDLLKKLSAAKKNIDELHIISNQMKNFNHNQRQALKTQWKTLLQLE